jgi:GAF domain-containing protein
VLAESFIAAATWRRDGFPGEDEPSCNRGSPATPPNRWVTRRLGVSRRTGTLVDPNDNDPQIASILVQMGGVLLNEQTVDRILGLVTELTERTVRSASAVSVTLVQEGKPFTPNASDPVARRLDEAQYGADEGPCLTALTERRTVNTPIDDDRRWPAFTRAAQDDGISSVLSVPLTVRDKPLGALNVYSPDARAFDDVEQATTSLLAQQGAAVLANAVAFADATALNGQLLEALATRDLIGQAKGILMAREHCDAEAAFDILRRASQRVNRKLRDVAADLVASAAQDPPSGS